MIKQKDVEKCRFFTTTGGDIWRIKKVNMITEVELENCETGRTQTCQVGEQSAERFIAINILQITKAGGPAKSAAGKKKKRKMGRLAGGGVNSPPSTLKPEIKPATQAPSIRRQGVRKGQNPSSQYLGVTIHQNKSGSVYYAQSSRDGKWKNLGVHKVEELAAAAVQEHLGNKDEAERLRKIAEQKTDTAIKELKGQTGAARFLCNGCGADYEQKPEQCAKCGGSSFEKIRRREKKTG